jgi:hypothetical protein
MVFSTLRLRLRQIALVPVGLLLITYLAVGNLLLRNRHIRYELTIKVRTPDGVRSGSSVVQATIERSMPFWGDNGIHHRVTGNAPAVELPNGRLVFALLGGAANVSLPEVAARDTNVLPAVTDWRRNKPTSGIWSKLKAKRPLIDVDAAFIALRTRPSTGSGYPTIVIVDPADAKSIQQVDWANSEDVLGSGFSLTGLELRFVNAPPDTMLDPPWLPTVSQALDDLGSSGLGRLGVTFANFVARRAG